MSKEKETGGRWHDQEPTSKPNDYMYGEAGTAGMAADKRKIESQMPAKPKD